MCDSSYYKEKLVMDKSPNIFSKTKKLVSKLPQKTYNTSSDIIQQFSEECDE